MNFTVALLSERPPYCTLIPIWTVLWCSCVFKICRWLCPVVHVESRTRRSQPASWIMQLEWRAFSLCKWLATQSWGLLEKHLTGEALLCLRVVQRRVFKTLHWTSDVKEPHIQIKWQLLFLDDQIIKVFAVLHIVELPFNIAEWISTGNRWQFLLVSFEGRLFGGIWRHKGSL